VVGGTAYCWGSPQEGQIGTGAGNNTIPRPVLGNLSFTTLAAGFAHTCGISNGDTYCWGHNLFGEAGNGTTIQRIVQPTGVIGGHTFVSLSLGQYHSCALTSTGEAYCWGLNDRGQLGIGTTGGMSTQPAAVDGGLAFESLVAGFIHNCGMTTGGSGYCWGRNSWGELGDRTTTTHPAPVKVVGQP